VVGTSEILALAGVSFADLQVYSTFNLNRSKILYGRSIYQVHLGETGWYNYYDIETLKNYSYNINYLGTW
jgi:hypothetical protein